MKPLIWGEHKAEYFFAQDWTGFRARRFFCLSGKSPRRGIQSFSSLQSVFYRLSLLCDGAIRGSPSTTEVRRADWSRRRNPPS